MSLIRLMRLVAITCAMALSLAACGSDDEGSGAAGSASEPAQSSANKAEAEQLLKDYEGRPSAFTVDEPLPKPLPRGTKFAYLQCGVPACALIRSILDGAVKQIGGRLLVVRAGNSTSEVQSAFTSLLEQDPDALLIPGLEPTSIVNQIKEANDRKIPIVSTGIMDEKRFGIQAGTFGQPAAELAGRLLAAQVVKSKGAEADVAFYNIPELNFSRVVKESFRSEMEQLCSSCKVRYVDVSAALIGNQAPTRVVSDLQANGSSNVAVFAAYETATGLPAALKTAGLEPETYGFAPTPGNLQDIKTGGLTAAVAIDFAIQHWSQVDAASRLVLGAPVTKGVAAGIPPMQVLSKADLPEDVSKGWSGYPDFAQRFEKLWAPE